MSQTETSAAQTPKPDLGFEFITSRHGYVDIRRNGATVTTLRGQAAEKFLRRVEGKPSAEQQQVMARVTGQYKFGNERAGKQQRARKGRR